MRRPENARVDCGQAVSPEKLSCFASIPPYPPSMLVREAPTDKNLPNPTDKHTTGANATDLLKHPDRFVQRHIGPDGADIEAMLAGLPYRSLDELADAAVPANIRLASPL